MILPASQVSAKVFDYIVIGKRRGLVVATRLSEDPSVSVLVIEAGPANLDDPEILNPARFANRFGNPQYDWAFQTVPQNHCKNRALPFPRGKCLGGSSSLNFFQYHRPAKSDIDAFEELGNPGWNWELLGRYYTKSEHFIEPVENREVMATDCAHHGPLVVGYPRMMSGFELPFQMAMKNLGINLAAHPFSGNTKGAWFTPMTIDPIEGVRSYAANNYYQPNATRDNLHVVVCAQVTKIVTKPDLESRILTAVEVAFVCEGVCHSVKVGKEVILSAGQTSGTRMFGLPPTCMAFVPLASITPAQETIHTSLAKSINDDIFAKKIPPSLAKQYAIQLRHQRDREPSCEFVLWPLFKPILDMPLPGKQYICVATYINHPFSRGSIHIVSSNPLVPPNIDPKYFECEYDLLQLVEQIKFCRKILNQEPMQRFLTGNEIRPGAQVQADSEIADFLRSDMSSTWHTVGSCSMLPLADGGVVDRTLKVYNTTNIRIVDISVIPLHIGAHTQATAYALGELGADIIKGNIF
ncbi:Alcohol oxidase [Mycena sanguinolenta]|uniref:Alcohol oxidase n=1 Tax=Mycena sanguinolenta TaxID=230812 RepID=A0A8H6Z5R9_9AGAR|nr:Alcohol oxidase [Mycena sanguinolenta]